MSRTAQAEHLALLEVQAFRKARRKIDTYYPDTGPLRRELYKKHIVQEHIKATVPLDLEALDEIEGFLLEVFRNKVFDPETGEATIGIYDLKDRQNAGMNAVKIVETKLRFAGLLEDPEKMGMKVPTSIEELSDDEITERLQKFGELKAVK